MTKKRRDQKRAFIRAYQNKLKQGEIEDSSRILYDLIKTPFIEDQNILKGLPFINPDNLFSCTQQFLMMRVLDFEFIEQINLAFGRSNNEIKHPLPPLWRKRLEEKHAIKAKTFHNHLLWLQFLFYWFFIGYLSAYYEWFKNFFSAKNDQFKNHSYSFFYQLTKNNLPLKSSTNDYENNTIISWFAKRNDTSGNIFSNVILDKPLKINHHNVYGSNSPWPRIKEVWDIGGLLIWSVVFFFKGLVKFLQGNFVIPMMSREVMLAKCVQYTDRDRLPKRYLFHNSGFFFRPLWTYIAQNKGCQIILYYYSTSDLWLQTKEGDANRYNPYHIMTWPEYWIWNEYQLSFLNRFLTYDFKYKIVGPIWFSSTSIKSLKKLPKKGIAIFDIEPKRDSYEFKVYYPVNYYGYQLSKQFFLDLTYIAEKHNINLFIKRKRLNKLEHKGYEKLINIISNKSNIYLIDSGIAAKSLIEKSVSVITMPFSTPANIAHILGKPSVFYDPFNMTIPKDPAAHGLKIFTNKKELEAWIISTI